MGSLPSLLLVPFLLSFRFFASGNPREGMRRRRMLTSESSLTSPPLPASSFSIVSLCRSFFTTPSGVWRALAVRTVPSSSSVGKGRGHRHTLRRSPDVKGEGEAGVFVCVCGRRGGCQRSRHRASDVTIENNGCSRSSVTRRGRTGWRGRCSLRVRPAGSFCYTFGLSNNRIMSVLWSSSGWNASVAETDYEDTTNCFAASLSFSFSFSPPFVCVCVSRRCYSVVGV